MSVDVTNGRKVPLTDADIERMRLDNLKEFPHHLVFGGHTYTCEECPHRYTCTLSMDPYNTSGDCLASK
jgi:hypothetical protein